MCLVHPPPPPQKTLENLWFRDVFTGHQKETMEINGLSFTKMISSYAPTLLAFHCHCTRKRSFPLTH